MNIIILTSAGLATGGVRQAFYLVRGLRGMGHTVDFVCRPDSETKDLAIAYGLTCTDLPKTLCKANHLLRSLMPEGKSVVLHAFHNRGVKLAAYLGTLWRLQKLPVVCVAHRGVTSKPGNPLPYMLPGIRAYMVNSKTCADTLPLFWRRNRCHLVSNGIPAERLIPTKSADEARRELDIPANHMVFGNVADHKAEKGAAELLAAFARAKPQLPPSTLVVVGSSPEQFMPLCRSLGIEKCCRIVPRTEHVADYLQLLSLMVFNSRFIESQPNVIMEAMSMGIPVTGSAVGGIPEMLPPDCLFDPVDIDSISRKMIEMAQNPARLHELAEQNLEKSKLFSMDFRLKTVMSLYETVLREAGLMI